MLLNLEKLIKIFFLLQRKNFLFFNLKLFYKFLFLKFYFNKNIIKILIIFNFYKNLFLNTTFYKINKILYLQENYNFCFKKLFIKKLLILNPLILLKLKIHNILKSFNFNFINSCDIEINSINFNLLNIKNKNIIKSFNDSFYIKNFKNFNILLRTHTSCVQIRNFLYKNLNLKIYSLGFVYRRDRDLKHLFNFNQLEIVFINKFINLLKLKYFFVKFILLLIKKNLIFKFRHSIFPFTNFSLEVDIFYKKNWVEISGMGLISNKILINMNLNYNFYKGFAIGLGLERLISIIYNINDINLIYLNDIFINLNYKNDDFKIKFI